MSGDMGATHSSLARLRRVLTRWPLGVAVGMILNNAAWGLRLRLGRITSVHGTTHAQIAPSESVRYIEEVFEDYKRYGGVDHFRGRAAEIGPGDNAGVALLMRNDGCDHVDLIDRYRSKWDPDHQAAIYRSLSDRHGLQRFRRGDTWDARALDGVNWVIGQSAEKFFAQCPPQSYDFVVSRAVVGQLYDPLCALRGMIHALRPGGKMIHQVGFIDNGLFTPVHDDLRWLEIPSWMWQASIQYSGYPNRVLLHRYRELLDELKGQGFIEYSWVVSHLVSIGRLPEPRPWCEIDEETRRRAVEFVRRRRSRLSAEFRDVSNEDLAVQAIFLTARKVSNRESTAS